MSLSRRTFLRTGTVPGAVTATSTVQTFASGTLNPTWSDAVFNRPYVDIDEWRDDPVRHRYVHGEGIQPVLNLTANGGVRADVRVGEPVEFAGVIEAPPRAGRVVAAEWAFDGPGTYGENSKVRPARRVRVTKTHVYNSPGTYFVALRGVSQRHGDPDTPFARLNNLARARVVVT